MHKKNGQCIDSNTKIISISIMKFQELQTKQMYRSNKARLNLDKIQPTTLLSESKH